MTAGFIEEWFPTESQEVLAALCGRVRDLTGTIIEVGSWEGRSTIALANAAYPDVVHAVDTWRGSPGEVSAKLASERNVFAAFEANIAAYTKGNVQVHREDWRDFFAGYPHDIKFCFIDATHTYKEVRDNIYEAKRHMVPGGIICGDDVHHPPVQQAFLEQLGNRVHAEATVWWAEC